MKQAQAMANAATRFANAPAFRTFADAANAIRRGLSVWFTNAHPTAPILVRSPDQATSVIANIPSRRDHR